MNESIKSLEPRELWKNFVSLNAIPRGSKKEESVIEFMKDFGQNLGLETMEDEVGNVIIRKPATPGMENRKSVILQSHLDMVHQKNSDTNFDFDTQGIEMYIDDDWVKAKGTTLGADNGLGVATIMSILESDDIIHPNIEALFTIDEETGMTGAMGLKGGVLNGDILLNLDTEEDDEIGVGCAGGIDITAIREYSVLNAPHQSEGYELKVKGLNGGHSGMDIDQGLANANKIMNRVLQGIEDEIHIAELHGGSLRNAIPRESRVIVVISNDHIEDVQKKVNRISDEIKIEYKLIDPDLSISIEKLDECPKMVISKEDQKEFIQAIYGAHNGVFRMSPAISDLVEASNNIAKIQLENGTIKVECLTRSSVESSKMDLANTLRATFELAGFNVTFSGSYPGWAPNMESAILKVLDDLYFKLNGTKANVAACHAGLECGILGQNYPNMDMISFGPTIKGAHSPDERASITSTKKFWNFVLEILKNAPMK